MAVLGINSRAASPLKKVGKSRFHSGVSEKWLKHAARELMPRTTIGELRGRAYGRIIAKETRDIPTGYLRAQSGTVKYGRGPLKVKGA